MRPRRSASETMANTMGTVAVASLAARAARRASTYFAEPRRTCREFPTFIGMRRDHCGLQDRSRSAAFGRSGGRSRESLRSAQAA